VVDNASTDGTSEFITNNYPEIELIRNEFNLGFAAAVNQGIKKGIVFNSEYFFVLNNDTIIFPETIFNLYEVFLSNDYAGIVAPKVLFYDDPNLIFSIGDKVYPIFPIPKRIGYKKPNSYKYCKLFKLDYVTGCAMLISKNTIDKIGYFSEEYFMYYEDAEYCYRARNSNLEIFCDGNNTILHKVAISSRNIQEEIITLRAKNRIIFFNSHHHGPFGFLTIPLICGIDIFKIIKLLLIEKNKIKAKAYAKGIITGLKTLS
jgi:GT2 family glycosyltransferase